MRSRIRESISDPDVVQTARGSVWLLSALGATTLASLAQNALVARTLGARGYGLFALVIAYTGLVYGVVDLRLWEVVTKYLTEFNVTGHSASALRVLRFAYSAEAVSALVGLGVSTATAGIVATSLIHDPDAAGPIRLYSLALFVGLGANSSNAVMRVFARFRWQSAVEMLGQFLRLALVALVVGSGGGIRRILLAYLVAAGLSASAAHLLAWALVRRSYGNPFRRTVRMELPAGLKSLVFSTNLTGTLKAGSDSLGELLLGYLRSPAEVGLFRMAKLLVRALSLPTAAVYGALYPRVAELVVADRARAWRFVRSLVALLLPAGVFVASFIAAASPVLVRLVGGRGFADASGAVRIVIWGELLMLVFVWAHPMAISLGRVAVPNIAWMASAIVWTGGSLLAVPVWGYTASAVLYLLSRAVVVVVYAVGLAQPGGRRPSRVLYAWLQPASLMKRTLRRTIAADAGRLKGRVIDIGCGSRPYRGLTRAAQYYGLDVVLEPHPDVVGSALELPFRDAVFDGVLCSEVLEHLTEPRRCLRETARVIRPRGMLLLTAPMMWYLHREPLDYFRFTHHGLREMLADAGFEVLDLRRTGGLVLYVSNRLLEEGHAALMKVAGVFFTVPEWFVGKRLRGRGVLAAVLILPINVLLTGVCSLLDGFSKKDVVGWVVLARRVDNSISGGIE